MPARRAISAGRVPSASRCENTSACERASSEPRPAFACSAAASPRCAVTSIEDSELRGARAMRVTLLDYWGAGLVRMRGRCSLHECPAEGADACRDEDHAPHLAARVTAHSDGVHEAGRPAPVAEHVDRLPCLLADPLAHRGRDED